MQLNRGAPKSESLSKIDIPKSVHTANPYVLKEMSPVYQFAYEELKNIVKDRIDMTSFGYFDLEQDIKKVADVCFAVVKPEYKQMCFDGLSRQIHPLTGGQPAKVIELCNLMPDSRWNNYCVTTNASASYAVGDRNVPFQICSSVKEDAKEECRVEAPLE